VNIVDVVIVLFFITALVRGIELGAIRQICSTVGLFAGLFLGAFVQGKLIHFAHTPTAKAILAVVIIVAFIGIFSTLGEYVGVMLRQRIERARRLRIIDTADRGVGSAVAALAVLLFVWLGASIFNNVPMQGLQRQIQGSVIIAQLNKSLPAAPDVVSRLGHLIDPNGFPDVFTGLEPKIDTNAPLPSVGELDPAVQAARLSVVKIQGGGCGGVSTGSGFVADTDLVITNAHVVAGVKDPYIIDGRGRHKAKIVWFNENLDMAVLRTTGLAGQPLQVGTDIVPDGTAAAVLGYPGGGEFMADPAIILDSFKAIGRNIYNQGTTEREVYSVKSAIEPGNSGGPVINKDGTVIGLVFAESTSYQDVGYALTMSEVMAGLNQAKDKTRAVDNGSCTQ
jgi:S1-C subfamily serine protease